MEILVYLQLFFHYTAFLLFMTFNFFYKLLRTFYWKFTGLHQQILAKRKPENYATSAQIKKILFRFTIEGYLKNPENTFLTVHEGFVNPERVLQDDCSLYAITATDAIFIQVKNRPDEIFSYDFLWDGQFRVADKLITIPLIHFNKLAETVKDEGAKIIFLHNQGRCGGTLVTALFRETGRCFSLNEPPCLSNVCWMIFTDHAWHGATARRMFRNTVRLLCKPYRSLGDAVAAYIIKPIFTDAVSIEMAHEVFPESILFFIYRDPMEVALSMRKISEVLRPLKLIMYMPKFPNILAAFIDLLGVHCTEYRGWTFAIDPGFEFGYRGACYTVYYYLEALKHGINIHGLRYDDLITNNIKMIKKIFQLCQLPDSFTEKAKEAMNRDSQANSPVSREILRAVLNKLPKPHPEFYDIARAMAEEFGIPVADLYQDKSFRLPNSLEP